MYLYIYIHPFPPPSTTNYSFPLNGGRVGEGGFFTSHYSLSHDLLGKAYRPKPSPE